MRAFLLLLVLCSVGCEVSGPDRLVGVWIPIPEKTVVPPIPIPGVERRVQRAVAAFVLKLRSDHTFVVASGAAVEGKWSLSGDTLTLTPSKSGLPSALGNMLTVMTGKVEAGYSRITLEQPTPVGSVVFVLRKSA